MTRLKVISDKEYTQVDEFRLPSTLETLVNNGKFFHVNHLMLEIGCEKCPIPKVVYSYTRPTLAIKLLGSWLPRTLPHHQFI
ncbi:MAG: hypothetical protein AAF208_13625 [Cyanobacteria bacterium P01_A01_bin.45]